MTRSGSPTPPHKSSCGPNDGTGPDARWRRRLASAERSVAMRTTLRSVLERPIRLRFLWASARRTLVSCPGADLSARRVLRRLTLQIRTDIVGTNAHALCFGCGCSVSLPSATRALMREGAGFLAEDRLKDQAGRWPRVRGFGYISSKNTLHASASPRQRSYFQRGETICRLRSSTDNGWSPNGARCLPNRQRTSLPSEMRRSQGLHGGPTR
jgi:hypothetical protein